MANAQVSMQDDLHRLHVAVGKLQPDQLSLKMKASGADRSALGRLSRQGAQTGAIDRLQYATRRPSRGAGYPPLAAVGVKQSEPRTRVDYDARQERAFYQRFWVSLALTILVLLFSPALQGWLGYGLPGFPGSGWITPILAEVVFLYGGLPFLQMARVELQNHLPGMMTLISLVVLVAFAYSLAALLPALRVGSLAFWELASLIDVLLLGCWIEMRGARQSQRN
jgi:cation transport ATPase